jgi:hypothetical protein
MISMARIQGPALGYSDFQKPIVRMGQFTAGPIGAGVTPPAAPAFDVVPNYAYPPNYAFPVQEVPVPTTPVATPMPTWAMIGLAAVGGAIVTALVMKQ